MSSYDTDADAITEANSPWRRFPLAVAGAFAVVFAVNVTMVKLALDTFPGRPVGDGFDTSNNYDRILDRARQEAALGWKVDVDVAEGHPVVMLAAPPQAAIEASAERPVGPREHTALVFLGGGARRVSETMLDPGQWDVTLTITEGTQALHTAKRVIVK
ncbi:MAG TPA: FixH family protein [Acidisphaera sp.]|nr:FixH family protein [Acidisphaera sp.]